MKVALYHNLPSGGALGHLTEVAEGLKAAGHTVYLFCPGTAELNFGNLEELVDDKMVFHRHDWKPFFPILNPLLYRTYLGQQLTEERYYVKHIMEFKPDLIYLGQCRLWTEPPLLRYLPKELPKVIYCAEPKRSFYEARFLDERRKWSLLKKLWRLPTIEWMKGEMNETIQFADHVLCNSEYSKSYISEVYSNIDPIFTPIGVNCETFSPSPNLKPEPQLLSVGALDPSKNHDMVIKVVSELPEDWNFKAVIITDRAYGDTADKLKNLAKDLEVKLEFHERIPQTELVDQYRKSFATIYCPILEPFGRVSIESQACGTPVLGRDEGGLKETIVSGKSGEKFGDDPKVYAEQIIKWFENPELYQKLKLSAREHVSNNWNQDKTIKNHVKILEEFSNSES